MNWIDTNILITICTFAIGLTQFLFWRYIARSKAYEAEKGKNTATKEDLEVLTRIEEKTKNSVTKEDLKEITLIAERAKNQVVIEDAQRISYHTEKGKNIATKQDIEEITKKIEIIRNEVSFDNQRKHSHIEQRTNRFLEVLHLAEKLQLYQSQLLYYLYDKHSTEKLSQLIESMNATLLDLIHISRILTVSINDNKIITTIGNLRNSSQEYVVFMSYIASNAISHLTDWKTFFDLALQNNNSPALLNQAKEHMTSLEKTRNEFEAKIKEKGDKLYDDLIKYLSVLKSLFDKEFHLKFDFIKPKVEDVSEN